MGIDSGYLEEWVDDGAWPSGLVQTFTEIQYIRNCGVLERLDVLGVVLGH